MPIIRLRYIDYEQQEMGISLGAKLMQRQDNIEKNEICNDGALSLCGIQWPKLKILNISSFFIKLEQNKIGCKGISAILTKQFNDLC